MPYRATIASLVFPWAVACGLSEIPRPGANSPGSDPPAGGAAGQPGTDAEPGPVPPRAPGTGGSGGQAGGDAQQARDGAGSGGNTADGASPARDAASPTPSGVQTSINGTLVPREKILVFLHIGHSNMAGRVTTPVALRPFNFETHPQLWAYAKGGVWKSAKEPLSPDSMNGTCGGVGCAGLPFGAGPGMSILRAALAAAPDAYVVSVGRGQSGLTAGYCRSFRKGGLLYDFVMAPAMELKGKVTFAAIWTMFGQSEVNDAPNLDRFGDCMAGIAGDMRSDLGEPDLPFLVGDWEEEAGGSLSTSSSTARVVIPQIRALPMRIPRCAVIPTDGLPINPLDRQHYDLTGYKLWAERGFALLRMNGWAPWMSL